MKIHILLTITNSYVVYCAVTIVSIFENNKSNNFCIHIICEDLSKENMNKLKLLFEKYRQEINIIKPNRKIFQAIIDVKDKIPSKYNISTFYRLFASEWLQQDIDRIIYLDCDIIIKGNLLPLWKEKMSENISLCAVHDLIRISDYHRLRICKDMHTYFNAGVMLINLEYWRKHKVAKQCVDYIYRFPENLLLLDQDTLNAISVGKIKYLHPKYNMMSFFFAKEEYLSVYVWYDDMEAIREAVKNPVVIHFAGEKPWFKGSYLPYRNEWLKYLEMTEWKGMKIRFKKGFKGECIFYIKQSIRYIIDKVIPAWRQKYPISYYK